MGWFGAALAATVAYGLLQAGNKLAATRGIAPLRLVFAAGVTVALLAAGALLATGVPAALAPQTLVYAAANSVLFTLSSVLLLLALRRVPAAVALPIHKIDAVLVIGAGALAFGERPTGLQWLGVATGLAVVVALTWPQRRGEGEARKIDLTGVGLAAAAAVCTAGSMTVGRLASRAGSVLPFVAATYALTAALAFAGLKLLPLREESAEQADAWRFGVAIGVLNFVGYLLLLRAFALGPMALVQAIFASSMLIAVGLTAWRLREPLTARHVAAIACSLGAALLIRAG
ncbi:MAG TPA: EamA family transporter [Myxococcales bacterium]|jgi:transporter family protein